MAIALIPALVLYACSSGNGTAPTPTPTAAGPASSAGLADPVWPINSRGWPGGLPTGAGHWLSGTLSREGQLLHTVFCLVTGSGVQSCVLSDPSFVPVYPFSYALDPRAGAMHGVLHMANASQPSGSGTLYAAPGQVLGDGTSVVADYTILGGSLTDANSQLDLTIGTMGEVLELSAYFDHYYYLSSVFHDNPLGLLSRVYADAVFNGERASLTIDDAGELFSQTTSGCVLDGQVAPIDSRYNAFTVRLTIAGCSGKNGAYQGVVTLIDFAWANGANQALFAVFNDDGFVLGEAVDWLDPSR